MISRAPPVSGVLLAVLVAVLFVATPARAATYAVGCSVGELRTAITSANSTATPDTINLDRFCTYSFTDIAATGVLLPKITTPITISGATSPLGVRATLARGTAPRLTTMLHVEGAGSLRLSNLTVDGGGISTISHAAIVSHGLLDLANVALTDHFIGMRVFAGTAFLTGITTSGNSRTIYNLGMMTIEDSHLSDNHQQGVCEDSPGVSNIDGGQLTIRRVTFEDNTGCVGTTGGAVYNELGSTTVVEDSTFTANSVGSPGGALWNGGTLQVARSRFTENSASNGGAIYSKAQLHVQDSTFADNTAFPSGGAIWAGTGSASTTITRSAFSGNSAPDGGALALSGGTTSLTTSTLYANTAHKTDAAGRGSGVYVLNATVEVKHVTFSANVTGEFGNGGTVHNDGGAVTAVGVLLGRGTGGTCAGPTPLLDGGGNVTDGAYLCPAGFLNRSPTFAPFGHYDGLTPTLPLANAEAIDVVPSRLCLSQDQRAVPRPQGPACDAGAWEDRAPTAPGAPVLASGTSPSRGSFAISWPAATDPDGTVVSYRIEHRDADDVAFTHVATVTEPAYAFVAGDPEAEGTFRYRVLATDGAITVLGAASEWQIVVDRTPPPMPTGSPDRGPDAVAPDLTEWWADTVTIAFAPGADPLLPDRSPGAGTTSTTAPATLTATGTPAGTSTDAAGNVSPATARTFHVDATPPTVEMTDCPASVVVRDTDATVHWQAADADSGVDGPTDGGVVLDTGTVGQHTATTPPVSDLVGHRAAAATCTYGVVAPPPVATTTALRVRHLDGRRYRAIATVQPTAAEGRVVLRDGTRRIAVGTTNETTSVVRLDVRLAEGRHRLRATYAGSVSNQSSKSIVVVVVVP